MKAFALLARRLAYKDVSIGMNFALLILLSGMPALAQLPGPSALPGRMNGSRLPVAAGSPRYEFVRGSQINWAAAGSNQITSFFIPGPPTPPGLQHHTLTNLAGRTNGLNPMTALWMVAGPGNGWATNPPCAGTEQMPASVGTCRTAPTRYGAYLPDLYLNTNFWLRGFTNRFAVSGVCSYGIWLDQTNGPYYIPNATLITRRHAVAATHNAFRAGPNSRCMWFTPDGRQVVRTVVDREDGARDNTVYQLDEDVPDTIAPARTLRAADITRIETATNRVALILPNQYKAFGVTFRHYALGHFWDLGIVAGDSGSPHLVPIGNEFAIMFRPHEVLSNLVVTLNRRNGTSHLPRAMDLGGYRIE